MGDVLAALDRAIKGYFEASDVEAVTIALEDGKLRSSRVYQFDQFLNELSILTL